MLSCCIIYLRNSRPSDTLTGGIMEGIKVEHNPDEDYLKQQGVLGWPVWTKEVSRFPWKYDDKETCYFIEGDVIVEAEGGQPIQVGKGDLVTFPKGMSCTWNIRKHVKKHYKFG
jgi:uncharacterized cupin superfamily protein